MKASTKVPVSERGLIQRLNRKLKNDDLIVKKSRKGSVAQIELGDYYIVDLNRNFIVGKNLDSMDLQSMGRAKKVLEDWEVLKVEDN